MIRALVVAVIVVLSGCAANNQAVIQQDESFADRIDDSVLSSNPNQQRCLEGKLPMIKIGVDPVNPYQFNPKTEDRYKIKIPIFVRTKGKKGKEVSGCIPPGTVVVAKKGDTKIERIFECGNPVLNDIYLPGSGRTTKQSAVVSKAGKDEKSCFTAGNFATGLGTGLLSFGLSTGEPISITAGAILSLTGLFDEKVYGSNSDPRCKAAFGIVGGSGGYSYGKSYNDSHKDSSSTSSSGGDTGGNGNGNSNGPATPPPVP